MTNVTLDPVLAAALAVLRELDPLGVVLLLLVVALFYSVNGKVT